MTNPYVFIVACRRSGTTLLLRMLSAHPKLVISPEAHWISQIYLERRGLTQEGMVTPDLIPEILAHPKFSHFRLGADQLQGLIEGRQPVHYSEFVTGIFDLYGKVHYKKLVGNKTPDLVRRISVLHNLWPSARFVHLVRDGRDAMLSMMNWPKIRDKKPGTFSTWKEDPVSTSALWWELNVRRGREAGEPLGPGLYHEVRYESLVTSAEQECRALCEFLGLEYDEAMVQWDQQGPLPNRGGGSLRKGARGSWMPTTPGLRNWRTEMSPEDVEKFEAAAGELLDELGYPLAFPNLRPEALAHSNKIRTQLAGLPRDVRPYGPASS